jgi:adenine-specific DNA-methyltransferase
VDAYFRQFSGHTQVNAADLRRLRYPSEQQLRRLAKIVGDRLSEQRAVDDAADTVLTTPHPR